MAEQVSALRWLIGAQLRQAREAAGLNLVQLAARLTAEAPDTRPQKSKLSRMESGLRVQTPEDTVAYLRACRADKDTISRLRSWTTTSQSDATTWWAPWSEAVPDWFRLFAGLEALCATEFVFESLVLPGLLQTEDYARVLTARAGRVAADRRAHVVRVRMERARRFRAGDAPRLHAVITEQALALDIGDPAVMTAQYQALIDAADRPNITIQILRGADGPHDALTGSFVLLDFAAAQSISYAELPGGAVYVQDPGGVETYRQAADSLSTAALSEEASHSFLTTLVG